MRLSSLASVSAVTGLLIHGMFSSSTPDALGIAENIIAVMLALFLLMTFRRTVKEVPPMGAAFLLGAGLLCVGILLGNAGNDISRDFIPFFLVALPLFVDKRFLEYRTRKYFTIALSVVGFLFSVRHLFDIRARLSEIGQVSVFEGTEYFIMDPAVLFCAIYLSLMFQRTLYESRYCVSAFYLLALIAPLVGLFSLLVRGKILLLIIANVFFFIHYFKNSKKNPLTNRGFLMLFVTSVVLLYGISPFIFSITDSLVAKTGVAGVLNNRDQEFIDVIDFFGQNPSLLILGTGWGGLIDTVASGGAVRYTHNAFLYFIFKGGLVGFSLFSIFVFTVIKSFRFHRLLSPEYFSAFVVFLYNIMIEPGYKMLTFGFIIMLVIGSSMSTSLKSPIIYPAVIPPSNWGAEK